MQGGIQGSERRSVVEESLV